MPYPMYQSSSLNVLPAPWHTGRPSAPVHPRSRNTIEEPIYSTRLGNTKQAFGPQAGEWRGSGYGPNRPYPQVNGYPQRQAPVYQQHQFQGTYQRQYGNLTRGNNLTHSSRILLPLLQSASPTKPSFPSNTGTGTSTTFTSSHSNIATGNTSSVNSSAPEIKFTYTSELNPLADPYHTEPRHVLLARLQHERRTQKLLEYQQKLKDGIYDEPQSPFDTSSNVIPVSHLLPSSSSSSSVSSSIHGPIQRPSKIHGPVPVRRVSVTWLSSTSSASPVTHDNSALDLIHTSTPVFTTSNGNNNEGTDSWWEMSNLGKVGDPCHLSEITHPPPGPRRHTKPLPDVMSPVMSVGDLAQGIVGDGEEVFRGGDVKVTRLSRRLSQRVTPPRALNMEAVRGYEEEEKLLFGAEVEIISDEEVEGEIEIVDDTISDIVDNEEDEGQELVFSPLLVFDESESGEDVEYGYEGDEDSGLAVPIVFTKSDEMPVGSPVVSTPWAGLAILSPLDF